MNSMCLRQRYEFLNNYFHFFPTIQAERKGVSNTVSGWIFGCFALVQFITSPIVGYLVSKDSSGVVEYNMRRQHTEDIMKMSAKILS